MAVVKEEAAMVGAGKATAQEVEVVREEVGTATGVGAKREKAAVGAVVMVVDQEELVIREEEAMAEVGMVEVVREAAALGVQMELVKKEEALRAEVVTELDPAGGAMEAVEMVVH